jgi:hypothetical protein
MFEEVFAEFHEDPTIMLYLLSLLVEEHQGIRLVVSAILTENDNHELLFRCVRRINERHPYDHAVTQNLFQGVNITMGIDPRYICYELSHYQLTFLAPDQKSLN